MVTKRAGGNSGSESRAVGVIGLRPVEQTLHWSVPSLIELERQVMALPDAERAILAAHLLESLPAVLADEDDGVAEALRRDAEMESNPSAGITLEELRRSFRS